MYRNPYQRLILTVVAAITMVILASIAVQVPAQTGASSCYDDGYEDGKDNPFSPDRYDACGGNDEGAGNNEYYNGFVAGCLSVEGNTADICEGATDD